MASAEARVVILGTGGTIAGIADSATDSVGYRAARLGVEALIAAVPPLAAVPLESEQVAQLDSKDMSLPVWLALAAAVRRHLLRPEVAGLVITHGTDTLEETAYFLHRLLAPAKPVVLTAAMRPATALSADGPLNYFNAVAVATKPEAVGRGVLVVVNDWIHGASALTKTSTTAVQTFLSPLQGLVGTVAYGTVEFYRGPVGKHTTQSEFSLDGVTALPRVDIIMAHENMDGVLLNAAAAAGAKGVVVAGVGNGNMTASALEALAALAKKNVIAVRSTRVAIGRVGRNVEVDDDKLGLVASDELNPQKARVLLRLALLKPRSPAEIQRLFQEY